jgi:hypothetical protein
MVTMAGKTQQETAAVLLHEPNVFSCGSNSAQIHLRISE